jgi:uncharacterized protein YmfQ (DUF2313 family)
MQTGRATDSDYLDLALRHRPRGAFYDAMCAVGRLLHALLWGLSAEPARIHNRILDAWTEADPRQAGEALPAWETTVGLPDELLDIPGDPALRRAQIFAKLTAKGGNNPLRFVLLAEKLGAAIVITCPYRQAARVEESFVEDLLEDGSARFIWLVSGACPESARTRLENLFSVYTPAHVACEYLYA